MAKTPKKPKVSEKEIKQIFKGHKPANRNETYNSQTIDIVKKGKTKTTKKKSKKK